ALADALPGAAVYFDSYESVTRWWPDDPPLASAEAEGRIARWAAEGADPVRFVRIPQLREDILALRAGRSIRPPDGGPVIEPAQFIIVEKPWGRERKEI